MYLKHPISPSSTSISFIIKQFSRRHFKTHLPYIHPAQLQQLRISPYLHLPSYQVNPSPPISTVKQQLCVNNTMISTLNAATPPSDPTASSAVDLAASRIKSKLSFGVSAGCVGRVCFLIGRRRRRGGGFGWRIVTLSSRMGMGVGWGWGWDMPEGG